MTTDEKLLKLKKHIINIIKVNVETPTRERSVTDARHIYFFIARSVYGIPFKKIGESVNRHHSSVIHSVNKVDDLIEYDKDFKAKYDLVIDNFKR